MKNKEWPSTRMLVSIMLAAFLFVTVLTGCAFKKTTEMYITRDRQLMISTLYRVDTEIIDTYLAEDAVLEQKEITDEYRQSFLEGIMNDRDDGSIYQVFFKKEDNAWYIENVYGSIDVENVAENAAEDRAFLEDISGYLKGENDKPILFIRDKGNYVSNIALANFKNEYLEEARVTEGNAALHDMDYEVELRVSLPYPAISHNADASLEEGRSLVWKLDRSGTKNVDFRFSLTDPTVVAIARWVAIIALTVITAGCLFIVWLDDRRLKQKLY